jgi:hypothetical protein
MSPDAQSDPIVVVAFAIVGLTCALLAGRAVFAWRVRCRNRTARRLAEMSLQLRAVSDRLRTGEIARPTHRKARSA